MMVFTHTIPASKSDSFNLNFFAAFGGDIQARSFGVQNYEIPLGHPNMRSSGE
jgi:hypothetical protein